MTKELQRPCKVSEVSISIIFIEVSDKALSHYVDVKFARVFLDLMKKKTKTKSAIPHE